jgi:anti-sigma factor RsiW
VANVLPGDSSDEPTVRYLLGKLSQADREDFEDRYFSDDALLEQLQAIEEELIDAYVKGRLDPADRAAFENRFLHSPECRRRVEFARALAAIPGAPDRRVRASLLSRLFPSSLGMRFALAGAATATVAAVVLMLHFLPDRRAPQIAIKTGPPAPVEVAPGNEAKGIGQTVAPPKGLLAPALAFALAPGVRGEGGLNRISIPPGTYLLRLSLAVDADADFPHYAAVLSTVDGREVLREDNLNRKGAAVTITVPSGLLPAGNYAVKLTGIDGKNSEAVAGYSLTVQAPPTAPK